MKLDIKEGLQSVAHRVIVGGEDNIPSSISDDDKVLFTEFLKTEDDVKVLTRLNSSISLVRLKEDQEKMRVAGAKVRAALPKEATDLGVHGSQENTYAFIEGVLLAGYQFNKYFGDKEKRDNKLTNLLVEEGFEASALEELINHQFWIKFL